MLVDLLDLSTMRISSFGHRAFIPRLRNWRFLLVGLAFFEALRLFCNRWL